QTTEMTRRDLLLSRRTTTSARDCALAPCRSRQVAGTRRIGRAALDVARHYSGMRPLYRSIFSPKSLTQVEAFMDPLSSDFDFNMLSLEDLLRARDFFHLHLMHKANVVGPVVGPYLQGGTRLGAI